MNKQKKRYNNVTILNFLQKKVKQESWQGKNLQETV